MTCKNTQNITIRFPRIGLELQPYTVDFRIDRTQLDYLDAKFSKKVGDYIEPYVETENAALRDPQPAEVVMDDVVTHRLYYRPRYVTLGETNCWIEFHDPQKHLTHTIVDDKLREVTAEGAYTRLFDDANTEDILTGIEFQIPRKAESSIKEETTMQHGMNTGEVVDDGEPPNSFRGDDTAEMFYNKLATLWLDYDEEADTADYQTIADSVYNFDVTNRTTLEAIYELNNQLGLRSWVEHDGTLVVGLDFTRSSHHVASAQDSRVWRYHEAELTPPATPIKMAVVNGTMIDDPRSIEIEDIDEFFSATRTHEDDLVPQGVAQRPDVLDGKVVSVDAPNLAQDALESRAYQVLANEMTNNNSGSVTINPETSGTEISDWREVDVGDFLQLIPAEDEDCRDVERQVVLISGVKHQIDGGSWKLKLDIQKWADPVTRTTFRYFNPDSNSYFAENKDGELVEIYADGS